MVAEWKLYVALAAIAVSFGLGWFTCHKFNQAAQDKADQAIIAEQQKNAQILAQISGAYEAGKQAALSQRLSSNIQLSKPNEKYTSSPVLPADRQLLVDAVTQANASR